MAPPLDQADIDTVREGIESLIESVGGPSQLVEPRGYPHLGLAILDAVFSLRARYESTVVPVLERYCAATADLDWSDRFTERTPEHGAQALLDTLGPLSSEERTGRLGNRQVAPGTSLRKADLCVHIAQALVGPEIRVDTHRDLQERIGEIPGLEWQVRRAPGVSGFASAGWRYLLNLSRVEKVKPDVMIIRWVVKTLGRSVDQKTAAGLVEAAARTVAVDGATPSVRTIDHLIWRAESGRLSDRSR